MTNTHSMAKTIKTKAAEAQTHYSKHLALHLKGNWLAQAGFTTGQAITITTKKW